MFRSSVFRKVFFLAGVAAGVTALHKQHGDNTVQRHAPRINAPSHHQQDKFMIPSVDEEQSEDAITDTEQQGTDLVLHLSIYNIIFCSSSVFIFICFRPRTIETCCSFAALRTRMD
eukprot:GEZU01012657.1.p1 GENE.GEZU01012657.1~~GEZU01012657.1.p1  ORF type:complete len:126 (+),score=8.30 GEZU01012657.1:32-379(+)